MACPGEDSVLAFVDGRLSGVDLQNIDQHFDACSDCRAVAFGQMAIPSAPIAADDPQDRPWTEEATLTWSPRTIVGGRYEIVRFIGRGGMGEVYAAEDRTLGTRIAIKTLNMSLSQAPHAIARLKREVLLARRVTHPCVCRTFDLGFEGKTVFLTMELLAGETLGSRLRRVGRFSLRTALAITEQVADALDAAHRVGVIHRDLKSDNIMLLSTLTSDSPRAVITDFGLARLGATGETLSKSTDVFSGRLIGTLGYMAPEQIDGTGVSTRTDVYALGVILYEMVTGRLPFSGRSPLAAAVRRVYEPAPSAASIVPDLPRVWNAAIQRCLERDPLDRFAGALDLAEALTASERASSLRSLRRRAASAVAAVALLAGAIMTGDSWRARAGTFKGIPERAVGAAPNSARTLVPEVASAALSPSAGASVPRGAFDGGPRRRRKPANGAVRIAAEAPMPMADPPVASRSVQEGDKLLDSRDELLDPGIEDELLEPYGSK